MYYELRAALLFLILLALLFACLALRLGEEQEQKLLFKTFSLKNLLNAAPQGAGI